MADYDVVFYDIDPSGLFTPTIGGFSSYSGPATAGGSATITDNEAGIEGLTLDDDSMGAETATADVTVGGLTSTGTTVDAELAWTLRDTVTGETFQIVQFQVELGDAAGFYLLSEKPLIVGRSYQTLDYDSNPDATTGDPVFTYADQTGFGDGVVDGTSGDDNMGLGYTDGGGDQITSGADTIQGGAGSDTIDGAGGDDSIDGGTGNDTVDGSAGNDIIFGGTGSNVLSGGTGNDTFVSDGTNDTIVGGDGWDVIDQTQSTESYTIASFSGIEEIFGSNGGDTWYWGADAIVYHGGDGDDTINAGTGDDSIEGGDGADSLSAGGGNDTVDGGAGDDTISGGSGDDILGGGDGADLFTVQDGFGDDTITGGEGGTDDDTIDLSALTSGVTVTYTGDEAGTITDGTGTITFSEIEYLILTGQADIVDARADDVATHIYAGGGNDTIYAEGGGDTIDAGSGDDHIIAERGSGSASLIGGTGTDTLDWDGELTDGVDVTLTSTDSGNFDWPTDGDGSFAGFEAFDLTTQNDTFDGSAATGDLDVDGRSGDDNITGGSGNDVLDGDGGNDTLIGGAGNDTLHANEGDDSLVGGDGNDWLYVGEGNDTLEGGLGDDFFDVDGTDGTATIFGGSGEDTLDVDDSDGINGFDITFTGDTAGTYSTAGGPATGTFTGIDAVELTGEDDTVDASADSSGLGMEGFSGDDSLTGGSGSDTIYGGNDDDTIDGGDGEDTLFGGSGDDTIAGGLGNDTLEGDGGNDQLSFSVDDQAYGGSGDDTFTLADLGETPDGPTLVFGGDDGEALGDGDTLDLNGLADFSTLSLSNTYTNASGNTSYDGTVTLLDGSTLSFEGIEDIVCFTRGTMIRTADGQRPIEALRPGDIVLTVDHGYQPLRWIGSTRVAAHGKFAPIRFETGVLGNDRPLLVSPQHRMLLRGWAVELNVGEAEVLVPARHLINDRTVARAEGGDVEYFHMLFDQHELIHSNGCISESYTPGAQGWSALCHETRQEILELFPDLESSDFRSYGSDARFSVKRSEAQILAAALEPCSQGPLDTTGTARTAKVIPV